MNNQLQNFKELDYKRQRTILTCLINYFENNGLKLFLSEETNPIRFLDKLKSECGINEAYKSLKIGMNDFLEMTEDFSTLRVKEIDKILKSKNLETLTQLRNNNFKKVKDLVQKKEIRNEEDYYFLINILNDENYFTIHENYRKRINNLIDNFEQNKLK